MYLGLETMAEYHKKELDYLASQAERRSFHLQALDANPAGVSGKPVRRNIIRRLVTSL